MELRPQNSQTSTKKNYDNSDMIILTVDGNNLQTISANIQENDQFWIAFNDQDILGYSNLVDNSLVIQNSLNHFSSQFWRCLFMLKSVEPGSSGKVYIVHCESDLYLCADNSRSSEESSILGIALTDKISQFCQFELQPANGDGIKMRQQRINVQYESGLRIKNVATQKYLQVTKQNAQPHLSSQMQTEITFKLHMKNQIYVQDLWITNELTNYLQNGDLVLLQNNEKNSCLTLQPKNQLIYKDPELKYVVNRKLLEAENYVLTERQASQINNSNIVYALWSVMKVGSFSSSTNSIVYNRDTIIFKHCFTNICLLKSWSGNNTFSSNLFELGKEGDQSSNIQNCGFHVKNTIAYCFDSKISNQNILNHQPLYLHDSIELDHRVVCSLKKVSNQSINFLRLYNFSIIQFSEVLLDFISTNTGSESSRVGAQYHQNRSLNKSISRKPNSLSNHQEVRQLSQQQHEQILSVDYDRLKQLIRAYHQIHRILIMNKNKETVCSNYYVIKNTLLFLQIIGNLTRDMVDIKSRKKPILQPLILSAYEYFINILTTEHFHLKSMILDSLKKMVRVDASSTISVIYYLSRIWNPNHVIDTLLELVSEIEPADQQMLLTCIADIIQHCNNVKQQQPKKIQQMFSSLNVEVAIHEDQGITIKTEKFQTYSIFDFREADRRALQLLKIAVFSQAFLDKAPKQFMTNQQILMSLIYQLESAKRKKIDNVNENWQQTKAKRIKTLAHIDQQEDKPFYIATVVEFINFYLLNICVSTISTLKNRKFVLLNPELEMRNGLSNCSLSSSAQDTAEILQPINNQLAEQSSLTMLKKQMSNKNITSKYNLSQESPRCKRKGKQNINVYSMINYDEPPFPVIQIIKHIERLIQNMQTWDVAKIQMNSANNNKIFPCSIREKPSFEEDYSRDDQRQMSKFRKSINAAIVSLVNYASLKVPSFNDLNNPFSKKISLDHLSFMLQGFNTLISIMDIILSVGYVTIKMICKIEQFALQITAFMIKFKNEDNNNHFTSPNFTNKYERTANELSQFYKQQQINGGLSVEQVMVEQKIRQLMLSINELFSTVLLLKKRLIAHPLIEVSERHHLLNFQECLNWYLQVYAAICIDSLKSKQPKKIDIYPVQKQREKNDQKFDMEIIRQLLNFYYGKYHNDKQEITVICLPNTNPKQRKGKNKKAVSKIKINDSRINQQNQQSENSNQIQQNSNEDEQIEAPEITTNKNMQKKFVTSFIICEEILYNIQLLNQTRLNIQSIQTLKDLQITKLISQMKKLFDIINSKLNEFKKNFDKNIQECIIRAYEVPEKLIQAIFCTEYFYDDFIVDIVRFLCEHPPAFHKLAKLHDRIYYNLPIMKIFVKSLQRHLQKVIKLATVQNQISGYLKQVVQTITKVIEQCMNKLKESQFILIMGVICQIFPNRTISERIYHILLEMHSDERNKFKASSFNSKTNYQKSLLEGSLKGKMNLAKGSTINSALSDYKTFRLNPGKIMDAFKTLQTFKDLVKQAQNEEEKSAQLMGYGPTQNANLTQNIYNINRHISLIFRLCQNSEEVNRHFTQNIIKYDSLLLIAFDVDIPIKYKIALSIYFRNDDRIIDDDIATNDYLVWITQILRQYEQYLTQLPQYIFSNDIQQQEYHNHIASKVYRQKANHKVSLMVYEHPQYRQDIGTSSAFVSSVNTKISPLQFYYWQLLFSRPFMHKEEGLLVFLEEIIINMKQSTLRSQRTLEDDINKSIMEIYDCLRGLRQKIQKRINRSQTNYEKQEAFENSISKGLLRKIRKLMLLIEQKFPKLRNPIHVQAIKSQSAVFQAANLLLKHKLMKKFIKVFYYNEYKNINLPLFYDKKGKDESEESDNSRLSFKHSRSSKMSHNSSSKDNFKIAQMALFKKTHKKVSIKYFQEEEDGCKSNAAMMLAGDPFDARKGSNQRTSTIKLNLNKLHHFEERAYKFYQITKLLSKVCELVYSPIIRSKLQENFINFFQFSESAGPESAAILKNQTLGTLKNTRNNYIKKQNVNRFDLGQCGFEKSIYQKNYKLKINLRSHVNWSLKNLLAIVKDLITVDEVNVAVELLKSIEQQKYKKASNGQLSKIYSSSNLKEGNSYDHLVELAKIFKSVSSKSISNYKLESKYLVLLKYLLLVFLPAKPCSDPNAMKSQKKISSYLAEYLNKILFIVSKHYEKNLKKNAQKRCEREKRGKKQTVMSMVTRMRESAQFNEFKLPELKMDGSRKQNIDGCERLIDYLPEMQTDLYQMIELYGISQARMSLLQKELYQLISNKLLKMVYGMTLGFSLKLILKALLEKCHFNSLVMLPDIISNNLKLQHFIELKIKQMSNLNNLISSNMDISENLSFISIFYDYMYRLLWDYYLNLHQRSSVKDKNYSNKQKDEQYSAPKIKMQMWQSICMLEEKIILLIKQQKRKDKSIKKSPSFFHFLEQNKTKQDHQRFCLLHKILSQSINLFNLKLMAQARCQKEAVKLKNAENVTRQKGQQLIIWNLSKFIQSRRSVSISKTKENNGKTNANPNFNLSYNKTQIYTELYQSLEHVVLSLNDGKIQLLFSFLNEHLSSFSIFRNERIDLNSYNNIFFYKKYGNQWKQAVINMIKGEQNEDRGQNQQKNKESGQQDQLKNSKQIKIFQISNYLIGEAPNSAACCGWHINHQLILKIMLYLSLFVITFCHGVIFMNFPSDSIQDKVQPLVYINLFCFVIIVINKLTLFWRVAKLKSSVAHRAQMNSAQSKPDFLTIIKNLITAFYPTLFTIVVILIVNFCSIYSYIYIPLLYFVAALISYKFPDHFFRTLWNIMKASWVPLLLMGITIWIVYFYKYLDSLWYVNDNHIEQDTIAVKFIKSISGSASKTSSSWYVQINQNIFITALFILMFASIIAQMRWVSEKNASYSLSYQKKCLMCNSSNQDHIKYTHNVLKWIDLQVILGSRSSSSLSCLQVFLRNKIQKQDSSIFLPSQINQN